MNKSQLKHNIVLLIIFTLFINSCKKINDCLDHTKHYIHLSHTRTNDNTSIHSELEGIDFSKYDKLYLGGDMMLNSSENEQSLDLINSLFNLGNPNTLWALGNHDYSNLSTVEEYTNRPNYFTYNKNNITYIVLDTQDSLSNIVGLQKEFVLQVLDTIQTASHLFILHHKLIWMYGNTDLEPLIDSISNGKIGNCFECLNPNNFYTEIYPKLIEAKQRGIEVLCIAGDLGVERKQFEYRTPEGIIFLASGMSTYENDNIALLFHHDIDEEKLTWEFKLINELNCK